MHMPNGKLQNRLEAILFLKGRTSLENEFDPLVQLISIGEVDANDPNNVDDIATLLRSAAYCGFTATINAIIASIPEDKLAQIINMPNKDGRTALYWSVIHNQETCAEALLKTGKIDLSGSNNEVGIAELLRTAVYYGFSVTMNAILALIPEDKLAQIVNMPNKDGYTALHWAAENMHLKCMVALLKIDVLNVYARIAPDSTKLISKASALDLAAQAGKTEGVLAFISHANNISDPIPEEALATAIYCANSKKDLEIVTILNNYTKVHYPQGIVTFIGGDPSVMSGNLCK